MRALGASALLLVVFIALTACSAKARDEERSSEGTTNQSSAASPTPIRILDEHATQPSPWPSEEVRRKAISLTLAELGSSGEARYGAFEINAHTDEKDVSCQGAVSLPCLEVGLYDYIGAVGIKAVVDLAKSEVVYKRQIAEYQPGPSEDDLSRIVAIIAGDLSFAPGSEVFRDVAALRHVVGYSEPELRDRNKCGQVAPRHRCMAAEVSIYNGAVEWVLFDLVEGRVVERDAF